MSTIKGSIEILTGITPNIESSGLVVEAASVEAVPFVVGAIHGYSDIVRVDPPHERARMTPAAEWYTTDAQLRPVTILLWREPELDETALGKALADAMRDAAEEVVSDAG